MNLLKRRYIPLDILIFIISLSTKRTNKYNLIWYKTKFPSYWTSYAVVQQGFFLTKLSL